MVIGTFDCCVCYIIPQRFKSSINKTKTNAFPGADMLIVTTTFVRNHQTNCDWKQSPFYWKSSHSICPQEIL